MPFRSVVSAFFAACFLWFSAIAASANTVELVGATSGQVGVSASGGASYSIPIAVPIGSTGVQPKLALQYSSQGGNGLLGMGWSILGQSVITRCATDNYLDAPSNGGVGIDPVDYDDNDKFCLNGERMMALVGEYGADGTEYRTAFESFSKIVSNGSTGGSPTSFTVYRKSGEIFTYGTTADSRVISQNQTKVRTWALKRITDVKGNYVEFSYYNDQATGAFRLDRVDYTGNDTLSLTPYNHVQFEYEDRPDLIKANMQGDFVQITKRLKNVKVYSGPALFHDYRLQYGQGATGRSRITSITECADANTCFKPTVFEWSADGGSGFEKTTYQVSEGIPQEFTVKASGDFNGDGLTDLYLAKTLEDGRASGGSPGNQVWLSNGDKTFIKLGVASANKLPGGFRVHGSGDFNGDGLTDFYTAHTDLKGRTNFAGYTDGNGQYVYSLHHKVYLSKGDGTFIVSKLPFEGAIPVKYTVFASGDFNGDGLSDFYAVRTREDGRAEGNVDHKDHVFLSKGDGTFLKTVIDTTESLAAYHRVHASGDFNGDGLTDFYVTKTHSKGGVRADYGGSDRLYLSKGDGTFQITNLSSSDSFPDLFSVHGSGDFNGDGLTDLFIARTDEERRISTSVASQIWLANGDGGFTRNIMPSSQFVPSKYKAIVSGDFNGDGLTDMFVAKARDDGRLSGETSNPEKIYISKGDGTFSIVDRSASELIPNKYSVWALGEFEGKGFTGFLAARSYKGRVTGVADNEADQLHTSIANTPDQITSITNGHGIKTEFAYKSLTDPSVYTKGTGAVYPVQDQIYAAQVVSELKADDGLGGQNVQRYQYSGMRGQLTGFGSLGFEKMIVTDVSTGIVTESTYSQDWVNHFQGLLTNEKTIAPDGTVMTEKTVNWKVRALNDANGKFVSCFRFVDSSQVVKRDLNGAFISRVVEQSTYDDYGYPSSMVATTMNEDGSEAHSKITTNTYTHDPATWRLGRLTDANVVHKRGHVVPTVEGSSTTSIETQVIEEDFEGAVSGWSNNNVMNFDSGKVLGTHMGTSSSIEQLVSKTFQLSGKPSLVTIEFDKVITAFGPNFDDFGFFINDQLVGSVNTASQTTGLYPAVSAEIVGFVAHAGGFAAIMRFTVTDTVDSSDSQVKIGFGSNNGAQSSTPGSGLTWAIDNLKLTTTNEVTTTQTTTTYGADVTSNPADDHTRTSSFTYNADGMLEAETTQPGSALSYTKTNTYNAHGAVSSISETWGSPETDGVVETTRTSSITYDEKVRFKLTETNPLGHTQTNTYDPVLGLLKTTTGPNGLTTTFHYDAFGRKTREERADGTFSESFMEACGGEISCPAGALYRVRATDSGGSQSIVFMDMLNREIRKQTMADDKWIMVDTVYNSRGQVEKKSEPYFEGDTTIYWTTITYDLLGRPITTVMADASTQSVTYNGLTKISTNEAGQNKTVIKNVMGQTVEVIDNHNKSITYIYDALGQMKTVTGNGKTQTFAYDIRGNKISDTDPDKGTWIYRYNALGKIVEQTDAKGQITRMTYDVLGRMLTRIDDADGADPQDRTATWEYDTAANGIGKLHRATSFGYVVVNSYDSLGRPTQSTETIDSTDLTTTTSYDVQSRPLTMTYPSGLTIRNAYDNQGALQSVANSDGTETYWQRVEIDERGNVTKALLGNGVETTRSYKPENGRLTGINTYKGANNIQELSYIFDEVGNLTQREDRRLNQVETFVYDTLNRVTEVNTTVGGVTTSTTMTYGITGNILTKSDVGTYTYGVANAGCTSGFAGPHAVTAVSGTKNATYCYDANGNMVTGDGRIVGYTAFDKPDRITRGANTISFTYGPDRKRFKRVDETVENGTVTTVYAGGKAYEWIREASATKYKHYIGDFAVITRTASSGTGDVVNYLHRDHLGSVDTITDHTGAVIQRMSFDAWGKRREINWQAMNESALAAFDTAITTRGFTGHEQLDPVGLIHMNGRVYDAELGRFLSADPHIQALDNLQNFNRYSYVLNNPLSYTDPTGFFFSKLFKAIGKAFGKIFKAIGRALKKLLRSPIIRAIIQIVACSNPVTCVLASGAMTAAAGGSIGDVFKAMAMSFIQMGIWKVVGQALAPVAKALGAVGKAATTAGKAAFGLVKGLVHGVVGGALAVAQGGNFMQGFAANAIGAVAGLAATEIITADGVITQNDLVLHTVIAAAAGCVSAAASGGKCANGAITAAFANIYNAIPAAIVAGCIASQACVAAAGATAAVIGYYGAAAFKSLVRYYSAPPPPRIFYHYTSKKGLAAILATQALYPSLKANNPNDARYGNGIYVSDIIPGTRSNASLAAKFIGIHFQGRKFSHYVAIETQGLYVQYGRPNVYVIPRTIPLGISHRLRGYGANQPR